MCQSTLRWFLHLKVCSTDRTYILTSVLLFLVRSVNFCLQTMSLESRLLDFIWCCLYCRLPSRNPVKTARTNLAQRETSGFFDNETTKKQDKKAMKLFFNYSLPSETSLISNTAILAASAVAESSV